VKLRFTDKDVEAFASASGDRNPLHMSDRYATTTPMGTRIVHGALVAWSCARHALPTGAVVSSLRANFYSPTEINRDYVMEVEGQWNAKLFDGRRLLARFEFTAGEPDVNSSAQLAKYSKSSFPRTEARTDEHRTLDQDTYGRYFPDLLALNLGLGNDWLAVGLAATSYFVGMEFPGQRALLKKFTLQHGSVEPSVGNLHASLDGTRAMARGLVKTKLELRTKDGPVFVADIGAFTLKNPSEPNVARDTRRIENGAVAITGGSRGIGLALAQSFRSHGHKVHVLARTQTASENEPVDLLDLDALELAAGKIEESVEPLTTLILNATSPLQEFAIDSNHLDRIEKYLTEEIGLLLRPMTRLISLLEDAKGTCVFISSDILHEADLSQMPPYWGHYAAAKAAGERLIAAASRTYPRIRFRVIRLPAVGTGLVFRPQILPILTPDSVANRIYASLASDLDQKPFDIIGLSDEIE
jgi:NAD(P)-dependent dehydrogenase (short-subunit alcohol dehydrogenase family)